MYAYSIYHTDEEISCKIERKGVTSTQCRSNKQVKMLKLYAFYQVLFAFEQFDTLSRSLCKEKPNNQTGKQVQGIVLNLLWEDIGKSKVINNKPTQGID